MRVGLFILMTPFGLGKPFPLGKLSVSRQLSVSGCQFCSIHLSKKLQPGP
jgi:hypothetical protein